MATASFQEVEEVLQKALDAEHDVQVNCASHGAAVNLRQRLNTWRMKDRRDSFTIYPAGHPLHGRSAYDTLTMRVPSENSPDSNCIYISKRKTLDIEVVVLKPPGRGQSPLKIKDIDLEGGDTK